jgi:hypothetical protein
MTYETRKLEKLLDKIFVEIAAALEDGLPPTDIMAVMLSGLTLVLFELNDSDEVAAAVRDFSLQLPRVIENANSLRAHALRRTHDDRSTVCAD